MMDLATRRGLHGHHFFSHCIEICTDVLRTYFNSFILPHVLTYETGSEFAHTLDFQGDPAIGCKWAKVRILSMLSWGILPELFSPLPGSIQWRRLFLSENVKREPVIGVHEHWRMHTTEGYDLILLLLGALHLTLEHPLEMEYVKYLELLYRILTTWPLHGSICGLKW